MDKVKLIIELDGEFYKYVCEEVKSDELVYKAIQDGTPLPKGHGRLIDADYLREDFKASNKISFAERMNIACIVDHAPTIIEADKDN